VSGKWFVVRRSRRENTRSPGRNGASRKQLLIVKGYDWFNCKEMPIYPLI
jgi:hypothetical protein